MGLSEKFERLKIAFKFGGTSYAVGRLFDYLTRSIRVPTSFTLPTQLDDAVVYRDIPYAIATYRMLKKQFAHILDIKPTAQSGSEGSQDDKIWWCWLQGEKAAPPISRASLASLRKNIPDKEIVVITEDNLNDYVEFPEYITRKYKSGIIPRPHFSDLLRLELLIRHGGTWIDSTVLCTARPDEVFSAPFFVYQTIYRSDPAIVAQNWLMRSRPNNILLIATLSMLYAYWEKHNVVAHYLISYLIFTIAAERHNDIFATSPVYSDIPPHIMQRELNLQFSPKRFAQYCEMSNIHKLSNRVELVTSSKDTTVADYIIKTFV